MRIAELSDQIGGADQRALFISVIRRPVRRGKSRIFDRAGDPGRVEHVGFSHPLSHIELRSIDMERRQRRVGRAAWKLGLAALRVNDISVGTVALQDAGVLYPAEMLTNLLNPSNNTVKKTLSAYQPTRLGDPDHDPVYEPITNDAPTLQKALYYRFGLTGEKHWRVPPHVPSVKTVQNLVGLPTAQISPVMQIFFGQCMDPAAQHVGHIDRKLLDFHRSPIYAQPENGYFDILYKEMWNQHETSKPTTAGNMLDEVRVNYYVLWERGKPLIDSRALLIESPTDVFEILRQCWGPSIDHVVERLVCRGMSFRLALVSTIIERSPVSPLRHRPVVDVSGGLGFRPQGYEPDVDDYFGYRTQLNFQLLHTRRGFLALQYGGLVARLARAETDVNQLLHSFDNGIPEYADCLWDRQSDHAYWFQGLARREIELLCGVYHIATGTYESVL